MPKQSSLRNMPSLKNLPLHKINDPKFDARFDYSPESVEDLVDSIRRVGIIEPLIVRKEGEEFSLIAGRRRRTAAEILQLATVPCLIVKSTDEEADLLTLHENLYRKDFGPIEEANFYRHLIKDFGWTEKQISERTGKSVGTVSERLKMLTYPEDIQEALKAEVIKNNVAKILAQITDNSDRSRYLSMAIKGGATAGTVELWKNDWMREAERRRGEYQPPTAPATVEVGEGENRLCFLCGKKVALEGLAVVSVHKGCLTLFEEAMGAKEVSEPDQPAN